VSVPAGATGAVVAAGGVAAADPTARSLPGEATLAVFVLVGALGGAHCLGMCGPLVSLYADRMTGGEGRRPSRHEYRQHALFNAGRVGGYVVVGAAMGLLGALLFDAAAVARVADGVRGVAGVGVGVLIVLAGVGYAVRGHASLDRVPVAGRAFAGVTGWLTARVDRLVDGPGVAALGLVHALLPCPLLYPAYLYAVATGSPAAGAAALGALGAGTVPTMFGYGTLFGTLGATARTRVQRVLGVAFVAMGYVPLSHGLMLLGVDVPGVRIPVYQPL
jgi:hypothetical protein